MSDVEPAPLSHAERGRQGADKLWNELRPNVEQRRKVTEHATQARGRVADALRRVDELETQLQVMAARLADVEQRVAA